MSKEEPSLLFDILRSRRIEFGMKHEDSIVVLRKGCSEIIILAHVLRRLIYVTRRGPFYGRYALML